MFHVTLQNVGGTHVDFSDDYKHGNVEGQSQTKVLFGHPDDSGVTAHLYDKEKRKVLNAQNRMKLLLSGSFSPLTYRSPAGAPSCQTRWF